MSLAPADGGRRSRRGFAYQDRVTLLDCLDMLEGHWTAVSWEDLEDILCHRDDAPVYRQVKTIEEPRRHSVASVCRPESPNKSVATSPLGKLFLGKPLPDGTRFTFIVNETPHKDLHEFVVERGGSRRPVSADVRETAIRRLNDLTLPDGRDVAWCIDRLDVQVEARTIEQVEQEARQRLDPLVRPHLGRDPSYSELGDVLTWLLADYISRQARARKSRQFTVDDFRAALEDCVHKATRHRQDGSIESLVAHQQKRPPAGVPEPEPAVPTPAQQPVQPVRFPGRPIADYDPFALGVHPSIKRAGAGNRALPSYVARNHDALLRARVEEAVSGRSQMVVLVGEPSTGKTRALFEALRLLPPGWKLWHPLSAEDLLNGLTAVGTDTVLWLKNADNYLVRGDGERAAVGVRSLLRDVQPLLVLGTICSDRLDQLTTRPRLIGDDIYQQARDLLITNAIRIDVPSAFTGPDLDAAHAAADDDSRLKTATIYAPDGRIAQYLAGVPALIERCQQANTRTEAVLKAAVDLCRYGHDPENLPSALLEHAASAYIQGEQWDRLPPSWFEDALEYLGRECRGVPGPLIRRRPLPGRPDESCYRLAGVLARWAPGRDWDFPPEAFWEAAEQHARTPADRFAMGEEAYRYGRYRYAARLFELAAQAGYPGAWKHLVEFFEVLGRADDATAIAQRSGQPHYAQEYREFMDWAMAWVRRQRSGAVAPEPGSVELEMRRLAEAGRLDEAVEYARHAAREGDVDSLDEALRLLEQAGERERAEGIAIGYANIPYLLGDLVQMRVRAGEQAGAERVAREAADCGHPAALDVLAKLRESAGHPDEAQAIRRYGLAADGSLAAPW